MIRLKSLVKPTNMSSKYVTIRATDEIVLYDDLALHNEFAINFKSSCDTRLKLGYLLITDQIW